MQLPENEALLCANCQKKAAVKQYTYKTINEMLCATCFDRWTVQDAVESEMIHIFTLQYRGQYDKALACVDAIFEAKRDRDHDGWLARSIASHRVLILLDAKRYAEALEACGVWAQLGFADVSERWMHALGMAHALEALGRDREALDVLEDVLGYEDPKYLPSALGVLTELVRFSDKLGLPVHTKWLRIAEAVAERYGVEIPADDSPGRAILALGEMTRSMQPKRPGE